MVNLDLSKVLPNRAYDHLGVFLSSFLPGLFFVLSLTIARPDLVSRLASSSAQTLGASRLAVGAMALFLAFVIGSGLILVDTIIQFLFSFVYQIKVFIYLQLCKWPLQQITQWLLTKPRMRGASLANFHGRVVNRGAMGFDDWRKYQSCWFTLTRRLLKVRYGIESQELKEDDWAVLYSNLGSITSEDSRGGMMMIAMHATGWAGVAAARIAPALQNRYYVGFSLFLILNGFLHAYYVALRKFDPRFSGGLAVRAVLREFAKLETAGKPSREPDHELDESKI